jgi:hypothetical protein
MKSPVFALALVTLTAAGTAAVILPAATAQSEATTPPPAPSMVSGLPDFTRLVERVGPAVVNIEAVIGGTGSAQARQQQVPDEMPEFFRRFFGPGSPLPGMPQEPSGRRGMSMGTGFVISADGYVLTNHHVVDGAAVQGRNVRWTSLLTMGESWHNNHHAFPGSARLGLRDGEWDPGWWALRAFELAGLAWNFRLPEHLPPRPELRAIAGRPRKPCRFCPARAALT